MVAALRRTVRFDLANGVQFSQEQFVSIGPILVADKQFDASAVEAIHRNEQKAICFEDADRRFVRYDR